MVRQGCPLSSFLFVLMENALSRKLEKERERGMIEGIQFIKETKGLNHSQFADDTLMIGGASPTVA